MSSSIARGWAPEPTWLRDSGGRRLAFTAYPAAEPWLHVLISHGFAEHRGWWHHVATALQARGVSAYTFDHFHHGRSDGEPASPPDYVSFTRGVQTALEQGVLPHCRPGSPLVLLGHSNGGLILLNALRNLPLQRITGLVLCSPLLGLQPMAWFLAGWPARLVSRLMPALHLPVASLPQRCTRDEALWDAYKADPLRFTHLTPRFLALMRQTALRVQEHPDCGGKPLLVLRAGDEQVVDPEATLAWYNAVPAKDKTERLYEGMRHELFNETGWEQVLEDVVDWLRARVPRREAPLPGRVAGGGAL